MNEKTLRHLVLAVCAGLLMLAIPAVTQARTQAQDQTNELEEWQRAELQTLVEVVRAAVQGQLVPTEDPFEMRTAFLKATDGNTYVPFTLTIDPEKVSASGVAMYLFVAEHQMAAAPATEPPTALYEDAYFVDVSAEEGSNGSIHISRAFTVPGGVYDVFLALSDSAGQATARRPRASSRGPAEQGEPEVATVMILKTEITVPDLWTPELRTSTVLLAEVVEPLDQPLTPEQQLASPYTLGTTRIVPKWDQEFAKNGELSLVFLVYNPRLTSDRKPDVTIEYNFHVMANGTEEFFNKTNPQQFSAQTLPPGFDMALGHQIVAGQSVPLSLFPPGNYRLEIKVTDNISGASVTNNVNFTVLEA